MVRFQTARWITNATAIAAVLLALWHSLIAPLLLFLGVLYLVATLALLAVEKKVDRLSVVLSTACLGILVGVYFAPLWIAEQTSQTPEGHLMLAEKFADRGQLLGNPKKALAHYRIAAEGGNVEAQARLGEALYFGHYGTVNRVEGIKWIKSAAANGHERAQHFFDFRETDE